MGAGSASGWAAGMRRRRDEMIALGGGQDHDDDHRMSAAELRAALGRLYEAGLRELADEVGIHPGSGFALVALGGLGRREALPHSDLDLLLVHERRPGRDLGELSDSLWYPLWDSGVGLDHSVRTVDQCLLVAASDLPVALALLDARVIAGDADLGALVVDGARRQWRGQIASRFDEVVAAAAGRRARAGVIAHRTEPDLKHGAGGLRDVQLVAALATAHLCDGRGPVPGALASARRAVLDARTELHRVSGRGTEILHAQYGDEVGAALGVGDRLALARVMSEASRTIAFAADQAIRTSCATLAARGITGVLRRSPARRPLAEGVVEHSGEVALARDARISDDPWLALRVGATAARFSIPVAGSTLGVLAERTPAPEGTWPASALSDLVVLLGSGPAQIPVVEALDRHGLWGLYLPEWGEVRDLPPRDRSHVHTVDRHLVQTAVEASALTTSVARADLLLLSALLHDLGKGWPGDHSVTGAQMAGAVVGRLGLTPADADTTVRVVRHHLLLAATARRDPTDPATVGAVLAALDGDLTALDVLSALTEADSLATGPGVWTAGRAHAHRVLVAAVRDSAGPPAPPVQPPSVPVGRRHGPPDVEVTLTPVARGRGHELTLALPGGGPTLVTVADVLTAVGLDIVDGEIDLRPPGGVRARMTVSTRFGAPVDPAVLRQHLRRAVDGAPPDTLRPALGGDPERAWDTARTVPSVLAHPRTDSAGVLLEARSEDRPGLLGRVLTATLAAGARVDWVVVRTRGAAVEDILALSGPGAVPGTASAVGSVLPGRGPATTPGPPGDTLWGGRRRRPRGPRGPGPRTREL